MSGAFLVSSLGRAIRKTSLCSLYNAENIFDELEHKYFFETKRGRKGKRMDHTQD